MENALPRQINLLQATDQGLQICGNMPQYLLPRLMASCTDQAGWVSLDLQFEKSHDGLRQMRGSVKTNLAVICQRCLQPMTIDIEAKPRVVFVGTSEGLSELTADTEAIITDKPVALAQLVEDELLLALPMMPKHEFGRCSCNTAGNTEQQGRQAKGNHPFTVLSHLKQARK